MNSRQSAPLLVGLLILAGAAAVPPWRGSAPAIQPTPGVVDIFGTPASPGRPAPASDIFGWGPGPGSPAIVDVPLRDAPLWDPPLPPRPGGSVSVDVEQLLPRLLIIAAVVGAVVIAQRTAGSPKT